MIIFQSLFDFVLMALRRKSVSRKHTIMKNERVFFQNFTSAPRILTGRCLFTWDLSLGSRPRERFQWRRVVRGLEPRLLWPARPRVIGLYCVNSYWPPPNQSQGAHIRTSEDEKKKTEQVILLDPLCPAPRVSSISHLWREGLDASVSNLDETISARFFGMFFNPLSDVGPVWFNPPTHADGYLEQKDEVALWWTLEPRFFSMLGSEGFDGKRAEATRWTGKITCHQALAFYMSGRDWKQIPP